MEIYVIEVSEGLYYCSHSGKIIYTDKHVFNARLFKSSNVDTFLQFLKQGDFPNAKSVKYKR